MDIYLISIFNIHTILYTNSSSIRNSQQWTRLIHNIIQSCVRKRRVKHRNIITLINSVNLLLEFKEVVLFHYYSAWLSKLDFIWIKTAIGYKTLSEYIVEQMNHRMYQKYIFCSLFKKRKRVNIDYQEETYNGEILFLLLITLFHCILICLNCYV